MQITFSGHSGERDLREAAEFWQRHADGGNSLSAAHKAERLSHYANVVSEGYEIHIPADLIPMSVVQSDVEDRKEPEVPDFPSPEETRDGRPNSTREVET